MIIPFNKLAPRIGSAVYIAPDSWIIGDVVLGDNVSVFFGAVIRGDILAITVGRDTNIQEHAILHTSHGRNPVAVGAAVTIGHRAIVHGCRIGDRVLIGMGAIVLDDTVIEEECLIGAGTVIPEGRRIPRRSLVLGVPGKVVRSLGEDEVASLQISADHYLALNKSYRKMNAEVTSS